MNPDEFLRNAEASNARAAIERARRQQAVAAWREHERLQIYWIRSKRAHPVSRFMEELRRARIELQELGEPVPTCKCGALLWLHVEGEMKCDKCYSDDVLRGEGES